MRQERAKIVNDDMMKGGGVVSRQVVPTGIITRPEVAKLLSFEMNDNHVTFSFMHALLNPRKKSAVFRFRTVVPRCHSSSSLLRMASQAFQ